MAIKNTKISPLLKEGTNITLTQNGQVITIAATDTTNAPGGSSGQVQFNDSGAFGGDAGLTYNKTTNVLGVESIDFATTPTAADAERRLHWDNDEGSLVLTLKGGNLTIPIGQEVATLVYNAEATTLTKGTVVYVFGASGQRISVKRAVNTSDATSAQTLGVVAESIASGAEGFVMVQGMVRGIDTSAYAQGDTLYLSATAGLFTKTKPVAPNHLVYVGFVVKVNASSGEVFVRPMNGYEMNELHNYLEGSVQNNDVISYESSTSLYKPKSIPTLLGYTPLNPTRNLTINGTTYDLSADRTWSVGTVTSVGGTGTVNGITLTGSITSSGNLTLGGTLSGVSLTTQVSGTLPIANGGTGLTALGSSLQVLRVNSGGTALEYATISAGGISGSGSSGQVSFWTSSSNISGSNDLFWDNTNKRLGLGTTSPNAIISLGSTVSDNKIYLFEGSVDKYGFGIRSSQLMIYSGAAGASTGGITFGTFDGTTFNEKVRFRNDGKVGINTSTPSYTLDVNGTGMFSNKLSVSTNDQGTSRVIINNSGTGGQSINLVAGNPNANQTGFSIAYGDTNILRFETSGTATFSNSVTGTSFIPSGSTAPTNGMYLPSSNTLAWSTNSSVKMTLDANGYLGIGTASPTYPLEIYSSGQSVVQIKVGTTTDDSILAFGDSAANAVGRINYTHAADAMLFYTSSTERMRIFSSGNVFIGSSPSDAGYRLQVGGAITSDLLGYSIYAQNSSGNRLIKIGTESGGEPAIQATLSNGTARQLSLNPSGGNVLIGTTTDAGYKLDVNGTGRFSDSLSVKTALRLYKTDNTTQGGSLEYDSAINQLYLYNYITGGYFSIYTNGVERLQIASTGATTFSNSVTSQNSGGTFLNAANTAGGYAKLEISSNATSTATLSFTNSLSVTGGPVSFSSSVTANGFYANAGNSARFYRGANDYYWRIHSDSSNYLNFGAYLANGTDYLTNPKIVLQDDGKVKFNAYTSSSSFTGTAAGYLAFDSSGNILTTAVAGLSGSGTNTYLAKFTGSTSLGNSNLIETSQGNIGLGVTPTSSWSSSIDAFQINSQGTIFAFAGNYLNLSYNAYSNGTNSIYLTTDGVSTISLQGGGMVFSCASSGTAGNTITYKDVMFLTPDSNIGIGTQSYGSGAKIIAIGNATTVPSANPTNGGVLYVEGGALKYRGSSGTITTIANA